MPLASTYVNPTQLTAYVPADRVAEPGAAVITVTFPGSPTPSEPQPFPIIALSLTALDPPSAPEGSSSINLRLSGAGFLEGATAYWNGQPLLTNFVNAQTLTAQVPTSQLAAEGLARVTISNPGGALSQAIEFTILPPGPAAAVVIAGVYNSAAPAMGIAPGSLITIYGSHLSSGSGVARPRPCRPSSKALR